MFMQQTAKLRVAFTSVLLLLYFAASAFGVEGSVLCLGQDGHFGIEFVGKCARSLWNNVSPSSLLTQLALQDDCGPCADITLFSGSAVLTESEQSAAFQALPALDVSFCVIVPPSGCDNCSLRRFVSDIAHTNIETLTSVVLMI